MPGGSGKGAIVIKAGHLNKLGGSRKNWKKRWFVLTDGLIAYYSKPNGALKGTIPIGLIAGVRRARTQQECSRKYALLVQTVDRKYQFQAGNSGERDEWIEAISALLPSKMSTPSPDVSESGAPSVVEPSPSSGASGADSQSEPKAEVAPSAAATALSRNTTTDSALADVREMEDIPSRSSSLIRSESQSDARPDNLSDPREKPHVHSVSQPYGNADVQPPVQRFPVPEEMMSWATEWPEYNPTQFTDGSVLSKPVWADAEEDGPVIMYNQYDEEHKVDRTSYEGIYKTDPKTCLPLNPRGRTGVSGRGKLGRFGPNHAADPIVSRWKVDPDTGMRVERDGKKVLEIVAIRRKDGGEWALPGGMVDPGESVSVTLKREFGEEALNSLELEEKQRAMLKKQLDDLFSNGKPLYRGYVDDRRNTDNAWMETTCVSIHDETGDLFQLFPLSSGDDAIDVTWIEYSEDLQLYANHVHFLALALHAHQRPGEYEPPPVGGMRSFRVDSIKVAKPKEDVPRSDSGSFCENGGAAAEASEPGLGAIHLGVHATTVDNKASEFISHTLNSAKATLTEEGAVDFMVLQQDDQPCNVAILEVYRDDAAIAAHGETEHCEAWRTNTKPLCTRTKAKWAVLPNCGLDSPLIPAGTSVSECAALLVDMHFQIDRLADAIEIISAFVKGLQSGDGIFGRALQQQPDWDGKMECLRIQCIYTSRACLENHTPSIDDLLLSLDELKASDPSRTTYSVLD